MKGYKCSGLIWPPFAADDKNRWLQCAGIPILAKKTKPVLRYLVPFVMYKNSNGRIDTRQKKKKKAFKTD